MKTVSTKVFFFITVLSFTNICFSQDSRGRISISWAITADGSPRHKASDWTQTLGFQAQVANGEATCPKREEKKRLGNGCKRKKKNVESGEWSGSGERRGEEKGKRKIKKLLIPTIIS